MKRRQGGSSMIMDGNLDFNGNVEELWVSFGVREPGQQSIRMLPPQKILGGMPPLGLNGTRSVRANVTVGIEEEEYEWGACG